MNPTRSLAQLSALLALVVSCHAPRTLDGTVRGPLGEATAQPASARSERLEANWKERLAQPFVFVEHQGDYRLMGEAMRRLFASAESQGIAPSGPPFALFYDDPGRVPTAQLRARACLPVTERPGRLGALQFEVLPRAMVVYARVNGPYPEVPASYPTLFAYLHGLGWQQGGPIRELYLVDPGTVQSFDELLTEVQIPWSAGAP